METLEALDRAAFLAINGWHAVWADGVMLALSARPTWIPLYLFFLFLFQKLFGWKGLLWAVPTITLMIICSDSGSVMLFKETVQRLRPCHEPLLNGLVHLVPENCGGQYGFVSSHASNHFAIALFMIGALRSVPRWAAPVLFFWAALIAYSRVYLGVHYPGDVLVGALYGGLIGSVFAWIFQRLMVRLNIASA